jgi:predicted transcriptional regulator
MSLEAANDTNSELKYQLGKAALSISIISALLSAALLIPYGFEAPEDRYDLDVEYLGYFFGISVVSIFGSLLYTMAHQPAEIERC